MISMSTNPAQSKPENAVPRNTQAHTLALIGSTGLSAAYARALAAQGVSARILDGTACTLSGLASLRIGESK